MVLAASLSRLLPHAPNFTALTAVSLFAGSMWGFSLATFLVPLLAMFLTDMVFGSHPTTLYVYGSVFLISFLGALALKQRKAGRIIATTFVSSALFYLVTNFGVWMEAGLYPPTASGLAESYLMGLPFLRNQILGDLTFTVAIFAGYELLVRAFSAKRSSL